MTLSSMQKNGLILAAFAVVATLLIVGTAALTGERIAAQQRQQLKSNLNEVLPEQLHDNDLFASCRLIDAPALGGTQPKRVYFAYQAEKFVGAAMEVTAPDGYSGAIQLLVAARANGDVLGVRVLEHQETPGLGDKIERRKSDWITTFNGLTVNSADDPRWAVKRDGGIFDQFTGATITPKAVVNAVAGSLYAFKENQQLWRQHQTLCEEDADAGI
ncbi:electron transport complex subunit RsxG [Thalassospira xiamenensis]|nr:electron transport complex subunit RsxG [Thalassospira xiamenensis]